MNQINIASQGKNARSRWNYFIKDSGRDLKKNKYIYIMAIPIILYFVIFHYIPLYGNVMAFQDYSPGKGFWGSPFVGFQHFVDFFTGQYFWRLFRNTVLISVYQILWGFPIPIILALLMNEISSVSFKRTVQTISYLPHFVSLVVVCGLVVSFTASDGIISSLLQYFGMESRNLMQDPGNFRTIFVASGIWQEAGWGSIIYLAAISSIDPQLYEAAKMDGIGRIRQIISITIPCILPTIIIMLIMRMGAVMSVGYEKIILLYSPVNYETSDVIASYVYRTGLQSSQWSFASAVGLFNSVINCCMVILVNRISRRFTETSLW